MTENKRYNVKREKRIDDYEPNNHIINEKGETVISLWNFEDCKDVCALLNEQEERIKELETVIQQILYETRANYTKGKYSVCVSVSPQIHDKLNKLLENKMQEEF